MKKNTGARIVDITSVKTSCEDCALRERCLPLGLTGIDLARLERAVKHTRKLRKGEFLYRVGESMTSLYVLRSGSAKTCEISVAGDIQITGFHLAGELLGMDGISAERHHCDAVALEASDVCEIPYALLEELAHDIPGLQHQLFRTLGREIVHDGELLLMLGKMNAEARLAGCLIGFSRRFEHLGGSSSELMLSMSRQDLGDYLGLALETVSRLFSRFQDDGVLAVEGRQIRILDMPRLKALAGEAGAAISPARSQN